MGIKNKNKNRTRKINSGGAFKVKKGDVDFGYTGNFKGVDCNKIEKNQRVICAREKFFFHCKKSRGKSFCSNKPSNQDKMRQDFYRKLIIEDCEHDSYACSRSDRSGEPKEPDDMCTYVNVCDDGMPASHIVPTIRNTYAEYKAFIDETFGDWDSMRRGNDRLRKYRKEKVKRIKVQMKKISEDYNQSYGDYNVDYNDDEDDEDDDQYGGKQYGGDDDFGDDDDGGEEDDGNGVEKENINKPKLSKKQVEENEKAELREKYSMKKRVNCERLVKGGKNPFKKALNLYYKYLRQKNALKDVGFSLSTDRKNMNKASSILQGKVQGYKSCLDPLSAGNYSGLKIFEKYLQLEEDISKLKNKKSIKRLGKMVGNLKSKYKSVKAQRQAFTDTLSRKPGKLKNTLSEKLGRNLSKKNPIEKDGNDEEDDDFSDSDTPASPKDMSQKEKEALVESKVGKLGSKVLKSKMGKKMAKKMASKFEMGDDVSSMIDKY